MNSILVTGCNRGLGLGIIKTLLKHEKSPKFIFATCRNLQAAEVSILIIHKITNLAKSVPYLMKIQI